jgi:hypothetical protein
MMKKQIFSALIAILCLLLIACSPANIATPTSTPTQEPVQTVAPTATLTPSPEPTPTPVPTLSPEEIRIAELNQQFQDFLNKEGEFTQEKIASMMMKFDTGTMLQKPSDFDYEKVKLGVADEGSREIQGYFFDYFEKDNRILLIMGFDGKDDNRFITLIESCHLFFVGDVDLSMQFFTLIKVNYIDGIDPDKGVVQANGDILWDPSVNMEEIICRGKNEIVALLNKLKGKVIALNLADFFITEAEIIVGSSAESIEKSRESLEQDFGVKIDPEAWSTGWEDWGITL